MNKEKNLKSGIITEKIAGKLEVYCFEDKKSYLAIPRGKLRKKVKTLYAGDYVYGLNIDENTFAIEDIKERKNLLIRPKVANASKAIIVQTFKKPDFIPFLLDSLLVAYDYYGLDPVIVFNKIDLLNEDERKELEKVKKIYENAGYKVYLTSAIYKEGIDKLKEEFDKDICILAGPSGVGKSSILSALTGINLKVQEVSEKTERGRHTTTGVKLIPFGKNSFIGDTPGFSKIDVLEIMDEKDVSKYFREFLRYPCPYKNCTHTLEENCLVKEAVKKGEISLERYKSYLKMIKKNIPLDELLK